ncbi:phosphonate transport system ATP-binding protein [Sporobacter termitidis DSM 10068]|uniref:Phosphonate transport system ATP-binding protein n=1 Tax=Sporobacter termitidis DSM 10068 TaxID=1123282 RepID=A0A1M5Z7G5_9FIRM|nr:phosphonate ABC transporter ATP-binding protein [Sporobacter termitidis]SHI20187.1 phosphonate transport system ATP-binding protein [Sporobacter termitidis DSM 10068]
MPLLQIKNVSKTYNNVTRALQDVSFSVEEGEVVSVIGPSGAGKSTLMRCINRLVDTSAGSVIFDGQDITGISKRELRHVRTKTGMIFQHYNLVDRLSVIANVLHGRLGQKSTLSGVVGYYSEREKENAFRIINKLGLSEQAYKPCNELSGGQKQRVGIARALMQEPKLLLCDEPIASLDPSSSKIIMDHLIDINETMNITVILNLHQVDVAVKYARRVIGITAGRVVYDGPSDALDKKTIHDIYQSGEGDLITDFER